MKSTGIKVEEVSVEFVLGHSTKEYNPKLWAERINSFNKRNNVKWYHAKPQNGYDSDRFFCEYDLAEGIRFFKKVSYIAVISDSGFKQVFVKDGEIFVNGFGTEGKESIVNNTEGRSWIKNRFGTTVPFSSEF